MEKASSSSCASDSSSMACDQSLSINSDQTTLLMTSSMLSRTSSSSSDYIGTESCFDVLSEETSFSDEVSVSVASEPPSKYRYGGRRREEREARAAAAREFPPPIPLLAQTENLHPHMPWVLKRVVTSDGRLILREEKVRHHEYFRAHRSNGRLTLHLVPLDDDVFDLPQVNDDDNEEDYEEEEEEEEQEFDDHEEVGDDSVDNVDENVINVTDDTNVHGGGSEDGLRKVISAAVEETVVESGGMVGGGGGSPRGKCLKSCFVDMRVREIIRPVLS